MKNIKIFRKLVAFPTLFVYLEIVLHIGMHYSFKYAPVFLLFALCYGAFATALAGLFGNKHFVAAAKVLAFIICLFYTVEYMAKVILATFYPLSTLGTAADNHLEQFAGTIAKAILKNIPAIIIMMLPAILYLVFGNGKLKRRLAERAEAASGESVPAVAGRRTRRKKEKRLKSAAVVILSLILSLIFFVLAIAVTRFWPSSDMTPWMLYNMDTNYDDQVEQLGLTTMARLDIKHQIIPAKGTETENPIIEPEPEPEPEEIVYAYNNMNFDFDAMLAGSTNSDDQWLTKYFSSKTGTQQNEYTGTLKDYNVIFITIEGFSGYVISEEYTPTLYKMANEGFVFNNFYTALHFTSTSNGECQNLLGLYPKNGNPITMKRTGELKTNCYFSLAQQLGRLGYSNYGFHDNQYNLYGRQASHTNLGYTWLDGTNGLPLISKKGEVVSFSAVSYTTAKAKTTQWPQQDSFMIDNTVGIYASEDNDTPFNVYYITISGHTPYGWNTGNSEFKDALADSGYSEETQGYIAAAMEMDQAMQHLLDALEAAGKLDNTLIVAAPDHIPYGSVEILEELTGEEFGTSEALSAINESNINFDVYKSSLIMWTKSMSEQEPVVIDKVCCQVDILPTISNLLGLEYDSRMLSGSDILSDAEGMVVFSSRCWKTDKGFYNRFTKTFTPVEGAFESEEEMNEYVQSMITVAANKLDCTSKIVERNFYNYAIQYLNTGSTESTETGE